MKLRIPAAVSSITALALVALAYWPAHNAGFVWDDYIFLHDTAEMRYGHEWIRIALKGFSDWTSYFRPLGVALFAGEARWFDSDPGPMHVVSVALHLVNTMLVGVLARSLVPAAADSRDVRILIPAAMLLFGLHAALVEPVIWISCQYELLATMFMLFGIVCNVRLQHTAARSCAVAGCFFLAACAKESAASFPLLLLTVDWLRVGTENGGRGVPGRVRRRQWPVYGAVFVAGILYLAFRYWSLGFLLGNQGQHTPLSWMRLHLACYTYLTYWKVILWPMGDLAPMHLLAPGELADGVELAAVDLAALSIAATGVLLLWKHKPVGGLITAVTVALMPVVGLIPITFSESFYHERYAMTAISVACAFLPLIGRGIRWRRELALPFGILVFAWLALSAANIRVTLPLWSDEVRLWRWSLVRNPDSTIARDNLLSAYLDRNDLVDAQPLSDDLFERNPDCTNCMLNVAQLAIARHEVERASTALDRVAQAMQTASASRRILVTYTIARGNLEQLKGDFSAAEAFYRKAITIDNLDPSAYMNLAVVLARQGEGGEARVAAEMALSLYPPPERARRRQEIERLVAQPPGGTSPPPQLF